MGTFATRKKIMVSMLAGMAAQAIPVASVQVSAQEAQRGLEEVIVTSRRTEEALQDVPLSITAMGEEALQRSNMQNFADLQRTVPSVSMVPSTGRRSSMQFAIRGQRVSEITTTVDPSVGLYMAEIPVARPQGAAITGFLDVGSLEVLKGPQGTLFGRNTTGGAIVISPNAPEQEFKGSAGVGFGNYNRQKYDLMLNAPITDNAAARIALTRGTRDGTLENRTPGLNDAYNEDYYAGRGSFRWQPTDALTTTFFGDFLKSSDDGGAVVLTSVNENTAAGFRQRDALARQKAADFFSFESSNNGYSHNEIWGVSNTTTYDLNDRLMIKNVIGYRQGDTDDFNDIDDTVAAELAARRTYDGHQFSEELQLQGDFDQLTWATGLFFFKEKGRDISYTWQGSLPSATNAGIGQGGDATNTSYSVFGQGTYSLTDALNLTVGARWTQDKRELIAESFNYTALPAVGCTMFDVDVGSTTVPGCKVSLSKTFSSPTWNVSLDYKLASDQMIYAATRRGYRTGGFSARPTRPIQQQPFDPETVTDLEVGYKGDLELAGSPLRVNVATFYSDYQDVQRSVAYFDAQTGRTFNLTRNAASSTIWGGELEMTWLPIDSLELTLFYARIHATFDEADAADPARPGQVLDLSYNRFATTPEHKGGVNARYQLPLSSDIGDLSLQVSAVIQSETWIDTANRYDGTNDVIPGTRQGGYTAYDARLDWDNVFGEPLRVSLWGKNLSNKEYWTGGNSQYTTLGFNQTAIGEPRTYGIDVKYNF